MISTVDIVSGALQINMMEPEEQRTFLEQTFDNFEALDASERGSVLFSLRESFFRAMTPKQKELYLTAITDEMFSGRASMGDSLEVLGQLIKYVTFDAEPLISRVLSLFSELSTAKDSICMVNFCKYVWDVCPDELRLKIRQMLQELADGEDLNMKELVSDVLYAIESKPICHSDSKVALVIPEFLTSATFLQQPIDFMSALSVLEEKGIFGDIIDNRVHNYTLQNLSHRLEKYDTVIITSSPVDMVQKYYVDFRYCVFCETVNWIYNKFPEKNILVCGAHGTVDEELLRKDVKCHEILHGESTGAVVSYLLRENVTKDCLLQYPLKLDSVDMKWYYGRKVVNGTTYRQKKYSIFQLSQGCPYQCIFCFNIYGRKVEAMPVKAAIAQLKRLKNAGVEHIFFIDQTFTLNAEYVHELCQEMRKCKLNFTWQCETRADLITLDVARDMKNAGCSAIWLGFESFSQEVLDANKKSITCEQQLEAIKILDEAKIACSGFVMLGMVGDTIETIKETIEKIALYKIPTSRTANLCTVRIGSPLFDRAKAEGIVKIGSFCHLEAYRGQLFNSLSKQELMKALRDFSDTLG